MYAPTRLTRFAALALLLTLFGCESSQTSAPGTASSQRSATPADVADLPDDEGLWARGSSPLSAAAVFFEFNATDDDLGLQLFLDDDGWDRAVLTDPDGRRLFDFKAKGELGTLGITELRFESAEPSPAEVLDRFPPGEYTIQAVTVEGELLVGHSTLSHALPPEAAFTPEDGAVVSATGLVVEWDAGPGVERFEIIVVDEDEERSMTVELPGDATELEVPDAFMEEGTTYKVEVLSILSNGNKTIAEHEFSTR